ncbi:ABC transporter permease [Xylanibacillus composti]|uniref:Glutathione ABC transporter permease GsiD n=1 Tax=Xylanibacillus composti TaxID=1572762 RepID=A0A8J4GZ45_9BACL|nr:ABC transporter permease [Xylanibacillus composti]MDT9723949.1 ABC transporter permease [Xylanibacillus composti]GIQ67829.1 glutathione ABC transporter permease GsiD [Xylanibacillus composti]
MHKSNVSVSLVSGLVLLGLLAVLIGGADWLSPYDPVQQHAAERLEKPSFQHPLGTDRFGRDILARTLHGGRTTVLTTVAALSAALAIGLAAGLAAGMFQGSWLDRLLLRVMDVLLAFPFMVLAMVVAALFGTSLFHLLLAVISVSWVSFARLTRSVVLQAMHETSFAAAKVLGAANGTLMLRELLPKALSPVLILATFELGSLMLSIAALSFLGLGAQPPAPEWGSMLADGRDHFMQAPHILLGPGLFIMLTVLAFNLIGEGLRDRLDPYEKPGL